MKSAFTLISSLFFLTHLFGQQFGDNNATWIYDHFGFNIGVTKIEMEGDTVVNGRTLRVLKKTAIRQVEDSIVTFDLQPVYILNTGGITEYSEDLIFFDTLLNFDADIGSVYRTPFRNSVGDTTFMLEREVIDTFRTQLNGIDVFSQSISYGDLNNLDTFYQNIGSRILYILPFDNIALAADGGEGGILRCFSDDVIGVLDFRSDAEDNGITFSDFEYDCDQLSNSTSTIPISNEEISVFPNPASNTVHIQSEREEIKSFSIYNLQGFSILEKQGLSNSMDVDIRLLPSGMYFVLVNEKYFEKVIVER